MLGKNHVTMNYVVTATAVAITGLCVTIHTRFNPAQNIFSWFFPTENMLPFGIINNSICYLIVAIIGLRFGSLLPDIDSETSTFGSKFHLPFKHRTWTHSVWAILLLLALSLFFPFVRFVFLGYSLHLIEDSLSASGICFTYPFKKYIEYDSGAFIAPGHKLKLYHTGQSSEVLFTRLTVITCVILCFIFRKGFVTFMQWLC